MSNVAAIVEQTAEIFASRARPMVPFPFLANTRPATSLSSRAARRKSLAASSIVQTHSFRLSSMTKHYACDFRCQPSKLLNKILLNIINVK